MSPLLELVWLSSDVVAAHGRRIKADRAACWCRTLLFGAASREEGGDGAEDDQQIENH